MGAGSRGKGSQPAREPAVNSAPTGEASFRLHTGDALTVLRTFPSESIHCVVTSPPYWGLRDYGTARWEGGSSACDHRESSASRTAKSAASSTLVGSTKICHRSHMYRSTCGRCGARRIDQQIGAEETPDAYVARLVAVFREARRVLRRDGTLWLNLGDSYCNTDKWGGGGRNPGKHTVSADGSVPSWAVRGRRAPISGLKPKDLIGIPWRVALALQADGWWLRADVIWSKPSVMPESIVDRPTRAHEYVFLLAKSPRYFFDAFAVREPCASLDPSHSSYRPNAVAIAKTGRKEFEGKHRSARSYSEEGRNIRCVWTVATRPFRGAHFATFPPKLVEPAILAGTSEAGCCAACGAPRVRHVERVRTIDGEPADVRAFRSSDRKAPHPKQGVGHWRIATVLRSRGWERSCACAEPVVAPCTVLDPFAGSGTTGAVATQHGRAFVGIDLNPEYVAMAAERLRATCGEGVVQR